MRAPSTPSPSPSGLTTTSAPGWADIASAGLDAGVEASGPHDFAVRDSVSRRARLRLLAGQDPPCNHQRAKRRRVHRILFQRP